MKEPVGPETGSSKRGQSEGYGQDKQPGWQTGGPFVANSGKFERGSDDPINQRRLIQIRPRCNIGHDIVPTIEHVNRRQNAVTFFAAKLGRPQVGKVNQSPDDDQDQASGQPGHWRR